MKRFSFGLSVSAGGFGPDWVKSSLKRRWKPLVLASSVAVAGTGVYRHHQQQLKAGKVERVKLSQEVIEMMCGAVGEIAQIVILYPLDTIKVRCQTEGVRAMQVLRDMSKDGANLAFVKALYAGAWGAAICSIFVGAAHYTSYCWSRRFIMQQLGLNESEAAARHAHSHTPAAGAGAAASAPALAAGSSARTAAAEAAGAAAAAAGGSLQAEQAPHGSQLRLVANISAAMIAALATALVEAPTELFRHNAQAGLLQGSFMAEMVRVVRRQGVRALYWGFLPYCFEAWPYDITELVVYGGMSDTYDAAQQGRHKHAAAIRRVPQEAWDLATGAVAGTAAVLVSMPFDCIKTYMQTHGAEQMGAAGGGLWANATLFAQTGRQLVAQKGWGSMFAGLSPRLAQQVPGAMVCWWAIEATRRALEGSVGAGDTAAPAAGAEGGSSKGGKEA